MSEWTEHFRAARWYGEVVFGRRCDIGFATETDYNYGYSHSVTKPDYDTLDELIPEGYAPIEKVILEVPEEG